VTRPGGQRCRPALLLAGVLLAGLLAARPLAAQEGLTEPAFTSFSSWETVVLLPDSLTQPDQWGAGLQMAFGIEDFLPADGLGLELRLAYRWRALQDASLDREAAAALLLSARLRLGGPWVLRSGLELGACYLLDDPEQPLAFQAGLVWQAGLRLGGRSYLVFGPALRWTPQRATLPWQFSLTAGLRTESAWRRPAPLVESLVRGVPELFSPDGDAFNDQFAITVSFRPVERLAGWRIHVEAPDGTVFAELAAGYGADQRLAGGSLALAWDGQGAAGRLVEPAANYRLVASAFDGAGRVAVRVYPFTVDILVQRQGDRYKIRIPHIAFAPNTAALDGVDADWLLRQNEAVLRRLISLFDRFPEYRVVVEGHANAVHGDDPQLFAVEQAQELLPLSLARAEAVRQALVNLGMAPERLSVVGLGGLEPLVPFADAGQAWKNRRVEFILIRR